MQTKLFEIRDSMTCLLVLCVKPWSKDMDDVRAMFEHERKYRMLWRSGYKEARSVIMTRLAEPSAGCHNDPFEWRDRTLHASHVYIEQHWDELPDGAMIDVRVALGELDRAPSESEFPNPPDYKTRFEGAR
jgi:hypothetical protein